MSQFVIKRRAVNSAADNNGEKRAPKDSSTTVVEAVKNGEATLAYPRRPLNTRVTTLGDQQSPPSTMHGPTAPLSPPYPRLEKPIVIPGCLSTSYRSGSVGLPFIRGYAKHLGSVYDISAETFMDFIDELNILNRGHTAFGYVSGTGSAVHTVGHLDPTKITQLVGLSIKVAGLAGRWASVNGPFSRKKPFLELANKELFNPKGLRVSIVNSKELRHLLNLPPNAPLVVPLVDCWSVPPKADLLKGQRAIVRVPHRSILALVDHVSDIKLLREVSPGKQKGRGRTKAALEVRRCLVGGEITFEIWRGQALEKLRQAQLATTEKSREKLLKQSKKGG